jgi:2-amino-4-hydroxy-6-hydroxymethyldihydropteridine diphosphokinase
LQQVDTNYQLSIINYQRPPSFIDPVNEKMSRAQIAYLGLGSNLGDRGANLLRGISAIVAADFDLIAVSSIYETEPVDYLDQPHFLNLVAAVAGRLEPFSLLNFCLETELKLGRRRTIPRGQRTIDIDLLMLDDLIIEDKLNGLDLTLPHPRMHLRRFVLAPISEIAPDLEHPVLHMNMSRLLENLDDPAAVRLYLD